MSKPGSTSPYLSDNARNALFDSPSGGNNRRDYNQNQNSNNSNYNNQQLYDQQKKQMQDQDSYLESLSGSVLRSKEIAIQIGTTAEQHTNELEQLNVHVDKTSLNLRNATRNVIKIGQQSRTTPYWITICILFLVLIVIVALAMST